MTQQPYYPPQAPGAIPAQPYAPPAAPAPAYQPQFPGYPGQQPYQAPPAQYAPQAPATAAAQGSLDAFYDQPTSGSGPAISWSDKNKQPKPVGAWYAGYVVRDVVNGDVAQVTNPQRVPQFYADGSPKWQMKVPLKGITGFGGAPEFPEGEGTWYVRGQARDELTRAMAEAGADGAPKAGAYVVIQLVQRRPSGAGFQPANIVSVQYVPAAGNGVQPAPTEATSPAPVAPQAPVEQQVAPAPVPVAAPPVAPPPVPQPQMAVAAPVAQQQVPLPPAPQAQVAAPQPPPDLSPEQQELLARLTAGSAAPAVAQPA